MIVTAHTRHKRTPRLLGMIQRAVLDRANEIGNTVIKIGPMKPMSKPNPPKPPPSPGAWKIAGWSKTKHWQATLYDTGDGFVLYSNAKCLGHLREGALAAAESAVPYVTLLAIFSRGTLRRNKAKERRERTKS